MVRLVIMIYVVGVVSYVGCGCSTNVVSMKLHRLGCTKSCQNA